MPDGAEKQQDNAITTASILRPETLELIKRKREAIQEETLEAFREKSRSESKRKYREKKAAEGKTVKSREKIAPLPGETREEALRRRKSERNASDYAARLARRGDARKNISRKDMTEEEKRRRRTEQKAQSRARIKAAAEGAGAKSEGDLTNNPLFGLF